MINVFVGREIDNATERRLLRRLLAHLHSLDVDAVVMANVIIGRDNRQIDLIVATATTAVVIEAKGYTYPVHGGLNGPWRLQIGEAREKPLGKTNPYHQALDCRYAVSDAVAQYARISSDDAKAAVKGALCLFPSPVEGSKIPPSDFKLHIGSIAELEALLVEPLPKPIPLLTWRAFAEAIGAQNKDDPFPAPEAIVVDDYVAAFLSLSRATSGPYVEPLFAASGVTTASLARRLVDGTQLHICGGSGSGKSELMNALAIQVSEAGIAPIIIHARAFAGELAPLLKKAVAFSTARTPTELFKALALSGREAILFVDGLNECPEARIAELLGALQAARLKFGFRVLTASQRPQTLPLTLDGEAIQVQQPDRAHARCLVEAHLGRPLSVLEEPALEIVATAHDCPVLSAVLQARANTDGRYALYAAFARESRKSLVRSAHDALADMAHEMRGSFVTTLPIAVAERFLAARTENVSAIFEFGLVVKDGGLFRFRHDLIADFYAADQILRTSTMRDELAAAAYRPLNADLREFILGGCTSTASVETILDHVAAMTSGQQLLIAGLRGRCGGTVRSLLLDRCRDVLEKLGHRYRQVRLVLPPEVETPEKFQFFNMSFGADPGLAKSDARLLNILPQAMAEGLLPEMLALFGDVDLRLESEAVRLRSENSGFRLAWRAAAYGSVYGMSFSLQGQDLNKILSAIQTMQFSEQSIGVDLEIRHRLDDFEIYTPGQLFLLTSAYRGTRYEPPPKRMNDLVRHLWGTRIYHLRLLAADMVRFHGCETPPEVQSALRETLDSWLSDNPWMNSIVVDAYSGVGGLKMELTVEEAISQYEAILAHSVPEERNSLALNGVLQTWDHPFAEVYWTAFYEHLPVRTRQAVLLCAIDVVDGDAMSLADAVRALKQEPTAAAAPRLRAFAERPWPHNFSFQSAIHLYANAVAFLAQLGEPLGEPDTDGLADVELAWRHGAKLLYAFNTERAVSDAEISSLWADLAACGPAAAIDVVKNLHREVNGYEHSAQTAFIRRCRTGMLALCRKVLEVGYEGHSIFSSFPGESLTDKHQEFALQMLGEVGRRSDLVLLRNWLDHSSLGEVALSAARRLEAN